MKGKKYRVIKESSSENSVYQGLKDYLEGNITATQLERYDKLFYDIKDSKSGNKKLSTITLSFNNVEDYFKTFDLGDDDESFVSSVFSPYSDSLNIYDDYYTTEDWNDGRVTRFYFNTENQEKLKQIVKIIDPKWYKVNIDEWNDEIYKKISNFFPNEIDRILSDFGTETNYAYENAAKDEITKDFQNLYFDYGIYLKSPFYKYYTTPLNLIELYDRFDPSKNKSLTDLLSVIGEEIKPWGDFWGSVYELDYSSHFDDSSFNREVDWQLEKILDIINDDLDLKYKNFKGYKEIVENLLSKFEFDKWYDLPVNKGKMFKINELDSETNKIRISVRNKSGGLEQKYLLTLNSFYSMLYNYSLFN